MDRVETKSVPANTTPAWVVPCLTVLIVGIASLYYWHVLKEPFNQPDSDAYIQMAEGHIGEVSKPFTNRVLNPAVSGFISRTTGWSIHTSFFLTNLVLTTIWVAIGLQWTIRRTGSIALALAIVLTPMTLYYAREIYGSDCVHAGLTAIFFLLIAKGLFWFAIPLLFVLQLARDSTLLLTFVFVLVSAYRRKWGFAIAAVLFTALGVGVVGQIAKQGKSNIHEQGTLVYLVGKVPFNFFTNVCGLRMWTNTHAETLPQGYPNEPLVKIQLPDWMPTGKMRQVGIYEIDWLGPSRCASVMSTLFGVTTVIPLFVIVRRRWRLVRDDGLSFVALLSLVYGVCAFLIGPCLGAGYLRLTSHGWPLAWIAAPELLAHYFNLSPNNKRFTGQLIWLQVICAWPPFVLQELGMHFEYAFLIALAIAIPCYVLAWRLLRRNWAFEG
jgi:hypothetical protein